MTGTVPSRRSCVCTGLLAALGVTATLVAHPDDPKVRDRLPMYEGPGYRSALGGANPPMGFPADGVELLSWISIPEFGAGASSANDCWGYTSPAGREYGIICLSNATSFVDITNPGNPVIVGTVPSNECTWHDVKIFEHPTLGAHAYVVSECGRGIQVVDISDIDNGNVVFVRDVTTGGQDSHNVALNTDSGYLYRTGGSGNGFLIYDLNTNPANPPLVGSWPDRYVHDAQIVSYTSGPYAGREIAFTCGGDNGGGTNTGLEILDVTNKGNIFTVARYLYPNGAYSHQGWLSEDRSIFYLNDELDESDFGFNTTTHVIDVSDITNPVEINLFTSGTPAIDHNLYVKGDLIFEANYRSGLRVFDATDPVNPTQLAYFDTYPENDNANFNGLWSCYPYFESGTVIASDREKGLFVMRVGFPLISYEFPSGLPETIDPAGDTVEVRIVELEAGGLVEGTERMFYDDGGEGFVETTLVPQGGGLYEATFPATTCGGTVRYYFTAEMSDGFPLSSPSGAPGDTYSALSAYDLEFAFQDDMESDPGYAVENVNLDDGAWERGVPAGDGSRGDPTADFDGSGAAWLTANRAGNSDVDGGPTRLTTPSFDLADAAAPVITYARWFTNDDNDEDRLDVHVSNDDGSSWTLVESVSGQGESWQVHTFSVADVISPLTAQMRLRFSATDNPNNSVTEAAIDALEIFSVGCESPCPEDLDGSGAVDFGDVLSILGAWGDAGGPQDLDESGLVDFGDILIVLGSWGACP